MSTTPLFTPTPTPAPIFAAPNTPAPTPSLTPAFVSATPAGGPYGQWAIANPYCVSLFTLSLQVQTLMLAWVRLWIAPPPSHDSLRLCKSQ